MNCVCILCSLYLSHYFFFLICWQHVELGFIISSANYNLFSQIVWLKFSVIESFYFLAKMIWCEFFYIRVENWVGILYLFLAKLLVFLSQMVCPCLSWGVIMWPVSVLIFFFVKKSFYMHWELLFPFSAYEEVGFSYLSATSHFILWSYLI